MTVGSTPRTRCRPTRWSPPAPSSTTWPAPGGVLSHGLLRPNLGNAELEEMERQVKDLKIDAWKMYTGAEIERAGMAFLLQLRLGF